MAVNKEANGRRWVQSEVEVPGTPEQVWQAIATGQGISAWFSPTEVEERAGGKMVFDMGSGMDSTATIKEWDPPRRLLAEDQGWAPGMPPVASEWTVEAREGGKCLVRVVHSLFASTDDLVNQLAGTETGWPGFFRILRLYLAHFAGQACGAIQIVGTATGTEPEAWKKLSEGLAASGLEPGQKWAAGAGAPQVAGTVEFATEGKGQHILLVRLDQPAPGTACIGSFACGGTAMAQVSLYLYGDAGLAAAKREKPLWEQWMSEQFPQPQAAAGSA